MRAAAEAFALMLDPKDAVTFSSLLEVEGDRVIGLFRPEEAPVVVVALTFYRGTVGRFLLAVPGAAAARLADALRGGARGVELAFREEDRAILTEVGNIMASACVSAVANRLRIAILLSVPEVIVGPGPTVLAPVLPAARGSFAQGQTVSLAKFSVADRRITGLVVLTADAGADAGRESRVPNPGSPDPAGETLAPRPAPRD